MNRYSYNRSIDIDIQYVIINNLGLNQFKVHLRYLVKCLEIKSFKKDIFKWKQISVRKILIIGFII